MEYDPVRAYENVKEGVVVVVVQDFFIQLLLDATVHLWDKNAALASV